MNTENSRRPNKIETLSTILTICVWNPPVSSEFNSENATDVATDISAILALRIVEQTVKLSVISVAMT